MSQTPIRVLVTGLSPQSLARQNPSIDAVALQRNLDNSFAELKNDSSIDMELCYLHLEDDSPAARLAELLRSSKPFDGIMIGWGVRGIPEHSVLFEECIDVVRRFAPAHTKLLFTTMPPDHLETVRRGFRV